MATVFIYNFGVVIYVYSIHIWIRSQKDRNSLTVWWIDGGLGTLQHALTKASRQRVWSGQVPTVRMRANRRRPRQQRTVGRHASSGTSNRRTSTTWAPASLTTCAETSVVTMRNHAAHGATRLTRQSVGSAATRNAPQCRLLLPPVSAEWLESFFTVSNGYNC